MKPLASLSLDLDNLWAYQMAHGDEGWQRHPSYLDAVVPLLLDEMERFALTITIFVVGQDAAIDANGSLLRAIADAGHEIGNHSFHHEPWLHRYPEEQLAVELASAEQAIAAATGRRPVGFRGPGYSLSPDLLRLLVERGYAYDCSTLPTFIGPLARRYYFRSTNLDAEQRAARSYLYGPWRNGLAPIGPYWWNVGQRRLLEIPVTVMPFTRLPFHFSYVLYLAGRSTALARRYFAAGLRVCRATHVEPSLLLHPLDLLGADDVKELGFFPGMAMSGSAKRALLRDCLRLLTSAFRVVPLGEHAGTLAQRTDLRTRPCSAAAPDRRSTSTRPLSRSKVRRPTGRPAGAQATRP
jgi:peptidoglycan-N-acetylglucosamine deacetylase